MKRESKIIEAQKNKKPTLRDDYQNMDIVFANVHRGRKLGCSAKSGTGIAVCAMELLREAA